MRFPWIEYKKPEYQTTTKYLDCYFNTNIKCKHFEWCDLRIKRMDVLTNAVKATAVNTKECKHYKRTHSALYLQLKLLFKPKFKYNQGMINACLKAIEADAALTQAGVTGHTLNDTEHVNGNS